MSKAEELFDIYDADMKPLGCATRSETHARGLWHRTFQCWIWDGSGHKPCVLFQERHPGKDTYPGLLDISCAGHLAAGESLEDGIRELEEELGLSVPIEELVSCGTIAVESFIGGHTIDREFCHVYIYRCDRPLTDYRLQEDEVTALYRMPIEEVRRLAGGELASWRLTGVARGADGALYPSEKTVSPSDFVPHSQDYYGQVLEAIQSTLR